MIIGKIIDNQEAIIEVEVVSLNQLFVIPCGVIRLQDKSDNTL